MLPGRRQRYQELLEQPHVQAKLKSITKTWTPAAVCPVQSKRCPVDIGHRPPRTAHASIQRAMQPSVTKRAAGPRRQPQDETNWDKENVFDDLELAARRRTRRRRKRTTPAPVPQGREGRCRVGRRGYEAKILKVDLEREDGEHYFAHYNGWDSNGRVASLSN